MNIFSSFFFLMIFSFVTFSQENCLSKIDFFTILSQKIPIYKLESLYNKIPDNVCIWGYDIGDFSGDTLEDLAFSFKIIEDNTKNLEIRLYVNDNDSLSLVSNFELKYYSIPIEIGFTIQNSECNITHKISEEDWRIYSYSYKNDELKCTNIFKSRSKIITGSRRKFVGYEKNMNQKNNLVSENYYQLSTGRQYFKRKYYNTLCYYTNKNHNLFFPTISLIDTNSMFITSGYLSWKDFSDLSISFNTYHDDSLVYFCYFIQDDCICMSNKQYQDYINLWIDYNPKKLIFTKVDGIYVRDGPDESINKYKIYFDNKVIKYFLDSKGTIDSLEYIKDIKTNFKKIIENYYFLEIYFQKTIFKTNNMFGFGWQYFDFDSNNEEPTVMSSGIIEEWNPSSLGEIYFIDDKEKNKINPNLEKIFSKMIKFGI